MASSVLSQRKIELLLDQMERLPTVPGVAYRLLPVAMSDRLNRRDLQMAIESDAALAARVVQLACEQSGTPAKITSIDRALAALPLDRLAADLLSVEIAEPDALRRGRLPSLWRHNLAVAMAAQVIASRIGTVAAEDALLAGILHDIGQVALAVLMPKTYGQLIDRVEAEGTDLLEAERETFGMDHAVLGKRMAHRWGFSEALETVIWFHHQSGVPVGGQEGVATLAQVVHLADLVARQEGLAHCSGERLHENTSELAERLGLSGIHAEQIGRQVASAIDLNAKPAGLDDEPTLSQMWPVLARANRRLGRLCNRSAVRCDRLESNARRADLLVRLNSELASCHSPREVLEAVAAVVRDALRMRVVVTYLFGRQFDYIEGVRCTAEGGLEDYFVWEVSKQESLDALLADSPGPRPVSAYPLRAERVEGWLFERQGHHLGEGPFYTVPMIVDDAKIGGLVWAPLEAGASLSHQEAGELAALASMAGVALKRVQAEADLVTESEELAEVNRELELAQENRLQQRNVTSLSEMAAGAAHEINNPLAIISGRAQQLLAGETDDQQRSLLESVIQQADRISAIISELHAFARPPEPEPDMVDPVALVKQVVADLEPVVADSPVRLQVESPRQSPLICVDEGQVAEALKEICRNAIDACWEGGTVTVIVQPVPSEEMVRLVVVDDGPGMAPSVRARAFDPFYSGYEAGRHPGLGLPKAYRAVQANRGRMALESSPGAGTTVRLSFPAEKAPAPA